MSWQVWFAASVCFASAIVNIATVVIRGDRERRAQESMLKLTQRYERAFRVQKCFFCGREQPPPPPEWTTIP